LNLLELKNYGDNLIQINRKMGHEHEPQLLYHNSKDCQEFSHHNKALEPKER
jgi:hypothetical protein